jgi:hypothetical protein
MIRDDGRVKGLDFGIAKRTGREKNDGVSTSSLTAPGVTVGTPLYMAPEQLRAEALDGRTDQFAWGVVAYELLTGKMPWSVEAGGLVVVSQILSSQPPPISASVSDVPPNVEAAVVRALAKDPSARFPTMDALVLALETPTSPLAATSSSYVPPAPAPASAPRSSGDVAQLTPSIARSAAEVPSKPVLPTSQPAKRSPARRVVAGALVAIAAIAIATTLGVRARDAARAREAAAQAAVATPALPACSNEACAASHGGAPSVCRASDHACVAVESQDCTAKYEPGDLASDDTVWLGAMLPTKGPLAADYGAMNVEGIDFARKEIADATSVLSGAGATNRVRRIALVACDDSQDPMRAAKHLVDDVGVPAILGFGTGQELVEVAEKLLLSRDVLAVATLSSNPVITTLQQPSTEAARLVWRTTFNFRGLAEGTAHLVGDVLEPRVGPPGAARVVLLRDDSVSGIAFADTFYRKLVLNGKPALDSEHEYAEIVLKGGAPDAGAIAAAVDRVVAARPTIVVLLAAPDAESPLMQGVEARIHATGARAPTYVLVNDSTARFASFIDGDDRRRRVLAVLSPSNSSPNARFVIRYNQARATPVTRMDNPSPSYDAFYLTAYGVFALGAGEPVSGTAIARGFARLVPPGKPLEVGPTNVLEALAILRGGGRFDLEGAASGLDFDLVTGEAPSDFTLLCAAPGKSGTAAAEDVETGVVYRAKTQRTEGVFRCP